MNPEFHPNVLVQFNKVKRQVAYILETKPQTRGNDALLSFYFHYYIDGWNKFITPKQFYEFYKVILQSHSPETITRCRRKLNEKGLYQPLVRTRIKRAVREAAIRENINEL